MKKLIIFISVLFAIAANAQETVYPARENKGITIIKGGIIHVGNGQVLEGNSIEIKDGKISKIGSDIAAANDAKIIDANGQHIYPGLILSNTNLGLVEINSVRATADFTEIGEYNSSVRSIVAYNSDSKVINTLRNTGVLLANIVPEGGNISGSSSVVQLDAWNWEDAAYAMDNGMHYNMPSLLSRPNPYAENARGQQSSSDLVKKSMEEIEDVKTFFREAKSYLSASEKKEVNLKFDAVKGLFDKKQKLYIHADIAKQLLIALDFKKEFGFDIVIMGGSESYQIAELLKQNDIPVILNQMHAMPTLADDAVDQPYKTPAQLQKAGVLFAINDEDGQHRGRNLPFNAGTAAAYGLSKEQALSAITLNAAKILGIADRTGSIEVGKDANIVISKGDILDMRSNNISTALIQGRLIDLNDKHKQLYERYKYKYGIE
ncbi:MAG: amidohydrolase family protein [Chitinophagaceae bacterium]